MTSLIVETDERSFEGPLFPEEAPESVAALETLLPLSTDLLHVRWSGHATWIPLDDDAVSGLPRENCTVYPSRGDVLLYPGYRNEPELLFACGPTCFKSPAGEQAGNHVATLEASRTELAAIEERTLQEGAIEATVTLK